MHRARDRFFAYSLIRAASQMMTRYMVPLAWEKWAEPRIESEAASVYLISRT